MARGQKGLRALLPPDEVERLQQLVETASSTETLRQRAQAVLAWSEGLSAGEAARRAHLSENQIRYLWKLYKQKGLDLFLVEREPVPTPQSARSQPLAAEAPGATTLEALCAEYKVDMAHARHVAALALQLFDATLNIHRTPNAVRPLLEAAALVHNLAYELDRPNHSQRGRDILLAQPIRGLSDDERGLLACVTAFHHKKVLPESEPAYRRLPQEMQYDALAMAAVFRIADGLDASRSQTTQIVGVQVAPQDVLIVVQGPQAQNDAIQAQRKADLWNQVFTTQLRVIQELDTQAPIRIGGEATSEIAPNTSVTRAGRAFALHCLARLEALIKHAQAGDLGLLPSLTREASRLAEAAVLADAKDFRKEIRWLIDSVEEARLTAALSERAAALAEDTQAVWGAALAARAAEWNSQAQEAIRALDARRFSRLAADLRLALQDEVDPNEKALATFQAGPTLWGQLAALRSVMEFGTSVEDALDAVRRLQDHLAAFRDLLGSEAAQALDMLTPLEGHLAAIQSTQTILDRIAPKPAKRGRKKITAEAEADLEALHNAQVVTLNGLADELPGVWAAVNSVIFRRAFALAIAAP